MKEKQYVENTSSEETTSGEPQMLVSPMLFKVLCVNAVISPILICSLFLGFLLLQKNEVKQKNDLTIPDSTQTQLPYAAYEYRCPSYSQLEANNKELSSDVTTVRLKAALLDGYFKGLRQAEMDLTRNNKTTVIP